MISVANIAQLEAAGGTYSPQHPIAGCAHIVMPAQACLVPLVAGSRAVQSFASSGFGGCSMSEALRMAREGWEDGARQVGNFDTSTLPLSYEQPALQCDVTGMFPDVGAYLAGEPECMMYLDPAPRPESKVRVSLDLYCWGGISDSWILDRAKRIARLVLSMIRADIPVEVVITYCSASPGKELIYCEVPVYFPGDVLSLAHLAYWLGHPAAYRQIFMAGRFWFGGASGTNINVSVSAKLRVEQEKAGAICILPATMDSGEYDLNAEEARWYTAARKAQAG